MPSRILLPLLFLTFIFSVAKASAQSCTAGGTSSSVTICMPAEGSTVTSPIDVEIHLSPVHLAWNATNPQASHVPNAVQVFLDGVSMFKTPPAMRGGFALNQTDLPLSVGRHRITVQAYDSAGAYKSTIYMH